MVLPKKEFNLEVHLKDHAEYFKQYQQINKKDLHFNFSFLDIQFFNSVQPPEKTMFELLQELKKPAEYKQKNGYYIDKNGNKKQKYTNRKIDLSKAIKIEAIHIKGNEGEYVMPHIHLILSPDTTRLGKDFSLLKEHIKNVSEKFGLTPNFAETPTQTNFAYKNLAKAVKNFSWIIRKMPNSDFKKYTDTKLKEKLELLWEYSLLTGNLQYYVKTLNFIQKRLNKQRIDFVWKEHNLRNTYPIPITQEDLKVIELINRKEFSQKAIKPYLNNAIMRDFIRYSYFKDKNKALIINSINKQTDLFKNLRPNKKFLNNYLKLFNNNKDNVSIQMPKIDVKDVKKEMESIKEILKEDLLKVVKTCKNEKELRLAMQKLGYKEFGFKKKAGKVIGYQFILPQDNKKIIVKCADSVDIKEIRAILKENWHQSKITGKNNKDELNEKSKITFYSLPKPFLIPKPVPIEYKIQEIEEQKEKIKEKMRKLRKEREENERELQILISKAIEFERNLEETIRRANQVKRDINSTKSITPTGIKQLQEQLAQTGNRIGKQVENEIGNTISREIETGMAKIKQTFENKIQRSFNRIEKAIKTFIPKVKTGISRGIQQIKRRIREIRTKIEEKTIKIGVKIKR